MHGQVDPVVYNMLHEDPGNVSYSAVGGLSEQIRELRESIELPLMNPELFIRVGIKPPKVFSFFSLIGMLLLQEMLVLISRKACTRRDGYFESWQ